jgi:ribonuclease HI
MKLTAVTLFVDGSCRGNTGPGGCCAVMQAGGREKVLVGGDDWTTNNRMELTAVLMGLQALKRPCAVTVVTDSQYVTTVLNGGRARANQDLVQQVRTAAAAHAVTVQWVAGHSGHELNERCHRLAYAEATRRLTGASARLSTGASARLSTSVQEA